MPKFASYSALGSSIEGSEISGEATAADTVRNNNAAEQTTTSSSYVKVKETLVQGIEGEMRIKFDGKGTTGVSTAYAKIYINGVATGTERLIQSTSYVTFSEDISGINTGDLVQIYADSRLTSDPTIRNLNICYDVTTPTPNDNGVFTDQDP